MIKLLINLLSIILCAAVIGGAVYLTMEEDNSEMQKDWDNMIAAPWFPDFSADETTPDNGGETPDGGSETPDGGSETPDGGSETPDSGSETPDGGNETPDGGSETPDAGN